MNVAAILQGKGTKVETVRPDIAVSEAARIMADRDLGAVVVCDRWGKVVGVLAEREIVRGVAHQGASALGRMAGELMVGSALSCRPEDDVKHVMSVMTLRKVRHLPV